LKLLKKAMNLTGLNEVANRAGWGEAALHVVLVDQATIEELNHRYLAHEGPTDVIAFDLHDSREPPFAEPVYGELYICLDVACGAARTCGTSSSYEVVLYAVHGMLHLVGFDDHRPDRREDMKAREREIMSRLQEKIGIGGIFATDPVV
jgi:probable rRNA maturation factor